MQTSSTQHARNYDSQKNDINFRATDFALRKLLRVFNRRKMRFVNLYLFLLFSRIRMFGGCCGAEIYTIINY